ncbi:Aminotransferase class IV [Desulfarculales bacterium]
MNLAANSDFQPQLWLNGDFNPLSQAAISPLDRGFTFGDGLFETLRAQEGRALFLEEHLARFRASARFLCLPLAEEPPWPAIIGELLLRNRLQEGLARVKIMLTRGVAPELCLPMPDCPTLLVTAQAYTPPAPEVYQAGWRLPVFRGGTAPVLAGHKSLSYLFYLWARQQAIEAGGQEALILDQDGLVAETALGSLLCCQDGRWWTPRSTSQLPGITFGRMRHILVKDGHQVEERAACPQDLLSCPTVWVLNSLMGIMPVSHIDGQALAEPLPELAEAYRQCLWLGVPCWAYTG